MKINKLNISVKEITNFFSLISFFSLLKFLVFVSPLVLNEIVSLKLYGEFEYTFSLGQTIVGIFSMGLISSYAYFTLTKDQKQKAPIIHMHFLVISLAILLIALTNKTLLSNSLFGSILIAISIANQQIVSGYLKIKDYNFYAIAIDTGIYIILFTIVVLSYFKIVDFSMRIWFTLLLIYVTLFAVLFHLKRVIGIWLNPRKDFYEVYRFGILVFFSGPLLLLINAGSRIYIEHFFDIESVGVYSYYFRISSVALIFSRVIHVLLFKKVFQLAHEKLDELFSLLIALIFLVNLILFLLLNFLSTKLSFLILDDKYLLLICFFQINFWISNSFLEPVIQRKNIVIYFIAVMLILVTLMFSSFIVLDNLNILSFKKLIWINTLIIYLLFLGQQYLLSKTDQLYRKSLTIHIVQGLIFIPTIFYLD